MYREVFNKMEMRILGIIRENTKKGTMLSELVHTLNDERGFAEEKNYVVNDNFVQKILRKFIETSAIYKTSDKILYPNTWFTFKYKQSISTTPTIWLLFFFILIDFITDWFLALKNGEKGRIHSPFVKFDFQVAKSRHKLILLVWWLFIFHFLFILNFVHPSHLFVVSATAPIFA